MTSTFILSATALSITLILCATALHAWRGWLELRSRELELNERSPVNDDVGVRIELAHVRERLKKLEAIASGVDL